MYESMRGFPSSLFGELDRLQRELDDVFGFSGRPASIRSVPPGTYPAINIGNTPTSVEIYAFAPGIDASKVEITLDRGVLTCNTALTNLQCASGRAAAPDVAAPSAADTATVAVK